MDLSYFDIIVTVIILLLGLKGIINGLFKELFALIGIVGGIFVASRIGDDIGELLSNLIFNFESKAVIGFSGFLVALGLFWLLMIAAGAFFKKLSAITGLGIADRIFGFIFGASKFFLIASVIAYATYNIKIMQSTLDSTFKSSMLFPLMVSTGSHIMKLDQSTINTDINNSIEAKKESMQDEMKQSITKAAASEKTRDEIKKAIIKNSKEER